MKTMQILLMVVILWVPAVIQAQSTPEFEAVVSLRPAVEGSCLAVEIRLDGSVALSGLTWFHNDGDQVFPQVVIVEGEAGSPPGLTNPGLVLDQVAGVSLDWGQLSLSTPVISSTQTAFAVFFFPEEAEVTHLGKGGGAGIGIRESAEDPSPFYVSGDGQTWSRFDRGYEIGVQPVVAALRGVAPTIGEVGIAIDLPEAQMAQDKLPVLVTGVKAPHPNPFNPRTTISFSVAATTDVELKVYDVRGRFVKTLVSGTRSAGEYHEVWNGTDHGGRQVASGVYYAKFEAGPVSQTHRMVLVR
jgi:hypothetical protein